MLAHLPDLFGAMLSNLLILLGLTYLVSIVAAAHPPVRTAYRGAVFGLMLGVVAGILVFFSVKVGNGVLLDLRYVAILISGLLGGPVAAFVTAALTLLSRLETGSSIVMPGIVIAAAAGLGVGARMLGVRCTWRALLVLGLGLAVFRGGAPMLVVLLGNRDLASRRRCQ